MSVTQEDTNGQDVTLTDPEVSQVDSRWDEWGSTHTLTLSLLQRDSCYVYVAWGDDRSRPLYIGKAVNPYARIATHMREKPWIAEVREWECRGFPSESDALDVENEAIHALNPIHNGIRRLPPSVMRQRWAELFERQEREAAERKVAERERLAANRLVLRQRARKPKPASPHPRRRLRRAKWREDIFTPDQLDIIVAVQNPRRTR